MNKSYVVIGGSSGIGRELVQLLEKEGNNVLVCEADNFIVEEFSDIFSLTKFTSIFSIFQNPFPESCSSPFLNVL